MPKIKITRSNSNSFIWIDKESETCFVNISLNDDYTAALNMVNVFLNREGLN